MGNIIWKVSDDAININSKIDIKHVGIEKFVDYIYNMADTETHMYCELVNSTSNTLEINILYKSGIKLNIKANKEHRSINWKYTVKDNVSCNNYYVFLDEDSIIQWLEKYNIKY